MSNRGLTGSLLTGVGKQIVQYYDCVYIGISAGYYLTNAPRDITLGGNTYQALGMLLGIGSVEENVIFEVESLPITLSGLPAYDNNGDSFAAIMLGSSPDIDYIKKPVTITRIYYDNDTVVGSFELYKGYIDTVNVEMDPGGSTIVNIDTSSQWIDFDRTNGRFTNTQSQASYAGYIVGIAGDLGFSFATEVQKDIEWK